MAQLWPTQAKGGVGVLVIALASAVGYYAERSAETDQKKTKKQQNS